MALAKRTTRMSRDVTTARAMIATLRANVRDVLSDLHASGDTAALIFVEIDKLDTHLERMDARTGKRDPSQRGKGK